MTPLSRATAITATTAAGVVFGPLVLLGLLLLAVITAAAVMSGGAA